MSHASTPHIDTGEPRRILVVAVDVERPSTLVQTVCAAAADGARVLVVTPARSSRAGLLELLGELDRAGIPADGSVGDADPAQAAADALVLFDADEVIVSSGPSATWSTRHVVRGLQARYDGPILELPAPRPDPRALRALKPLPLT